MRAEGALRFLAEASAALARSLDYERTLKEVVTLAVPDFADWCSVDVLRPDGSLRGITSGQPDPEQERLLLELSRRYREQKAGSEGVLHVIETDESELVTDVVGHSAVPLRDDELEAYGELAPASCMIVPLRARGRTIGALTFLALGGSRHYNETDLDFAHHLARRFGLAIDNARLYEEAERARAQLDSVFASVPVGLALYDTDLRCVQINEALAAMNGIPVGDHIGRTVFELVGEELGEEVSAAFRQVLETGEALSDIEYAGETRACPGETRHWLGSYIPVKGPDGTPIGVSVVVIDVTERRRLLESERAARRRATFLAHAGEILDASLDYEETLANVTRIAVPAISDGCAIQLLDERGELRQVAVAHADPAKEDLAWELWRRYPPRPDDASGAFKVIRSGESELIPRVTDDLLVMAARDGGHLELLRRLDVRSAITAPLRVRGRTLGVLGLLSSESGAIFTEDDLRLAEDVARRAAIAVENARLYTERTRIAHTLQTRLLPMRLPEIEGGELAVRYRAAGELQEVGGDFYDVFDHPDGGWQLMIGDVVGKGPEASATTALARYTLRAAALQTPEQDAVLGILNEAMLREGGDLCTVCVARFRPRSETAELRLALAGHPPALVLRADGTVEPAGEYGTIVGASHEAGFEESTLEMRPGDTLVLYTDGVIETGPLGGHLGEAGLASMLAGLRGRSPEEIVDTLERKAMERSGGDTRDDIALIALRFQPDPVAAGMRGAAPGAPANG
ncbi:MAG: SpoIIE family protein phosphatase [Thermoleophilaceae bacterium]|nr:SpoIIE family protein phosphatase [Thermoleophilaceae bacterium]